MPRLRFTARVADARAVHDTPKFDIGNRLFVLSLPSGTYESEVDSENDLVRINRVDADHPREFVAAVPAGTYSIENDESGAHLYREPTDESVRTPIMGSTADFANRAAAERVALRSLNANNRDFWQRQPSAAGSTTLAGRR